MEKENLDIYNLVENELIREGIWFTQKSDPTYKDAKSYYKLDKYGDPEEKTKNTIAEEVKSLIGDGAIDIPDAIEMWKNDQMIEARLDFKSNLVTTFEPKPVVDNIEAYENPVQFPSSRKVEAKEKKTEGPGAGYNIGGTIKDVKVLSFTIEKDDLVNNEHFGNLPERYFVLNCDIEANVEDCEFASYGYGSKLDFPTEIKITNLTLIDQNYDEGDDEHTEVDNDTIEEALEGATFNEVIGGGYVHTPFSGSFEATLDGSVYSDLYADTCDIEFLNAEVVSFIDKKVDGVLDEVTYCVYDVNNDPVDDFENEDDAIKFAEENGYAEVVEKYHDYKLISADGSIDDNSYEDGDIVWKREDDEVEESKKVTEADETELYSYLDANSYNKEEVEGNVHNYRSEAPTLDFKIFRDTSGMYFVEFTGTKKDLVDYLTNKLGWYTEKEIEEQDLISPCKKVTEGMVTLSDDDKEKYYCCKGLVSGQTTPYDLYKIDDKYYNANGIEIDKEDVEADTANFNRVFGGKKTEDYDYDAYIKEQEELKKQYKDRIMKSATPEIINAFNDLNDLLNGGGTTIALDGFYFPEKAITVVELADKNYHLNPSMDLTTSNILNMVGNNDTFEQAIDELFADYDANSAYSWADNFVTVLSKLDFDIQDADDEEFEECKKVENFVNDDGIEIVDDKESGFTYAKIFADFFVADKDNAEEEVNKFLDKYTTELGGRTETLKSMLEYLDNWNYHTYVDILEKKLKDSELLECNVNFNNRTKDKKIEAITDNFYSAFDSHGFRRRIDKDTTIEELMNELYNFITFENISQDDMRKAIRDIVNHINVQFNANLDPERMYLWYINGNYGGTYEKVRKNRITENYQKRLQEVNNKSANLIADAMQADGFDAESDAGKILVRTQQLFTALSDKGLDVDVTLDNGESTSTIQLGTAGGKIVITVTNVDKPLQAFISGNVEINDDILNEFQQVKDCIKTV